LNNKIMNIYKQPTFISLAIIFVALVIAGFIVAVPIYAQENTIVFPVAELDNCESKEACMEYCDEPGNMSRCITFAKAHNLMTPEEAERAEEFSDTLEERGGGPGGCTTPSSCETYCEDITNLRECLVFAEDHGHVDDNIEEGKKIALYLDAGGQMPGGCTSRQSCESYCSDFNHGEECLLFAEEVGLEIDDKDHPDGPNKEQMRAMIDLMKRGETPGGCTSERECESYCSESGNIEECVAFGEKVGFISPEEAEMVRKTGGKGPGGCTSREECDSFCNNPDNRDQCFAFAKEHGFIDEREIKNLEEGVGRLREVLDEAPEEAVECLKHNLGDNIIRDIQEGNVSPGQEFAGKVEACIHKGFEEEGRRGFEDMMNNMPSEVRSCIEEKVEGDIKEAFTQTRNNELEQVVKGCFESFKPAFDEGFRGDPGEGYEGDFDKDFDDEIFRREEGPRVFHDSEDSDRDFNGDFERGRRFDDGFGSGEFDSTGFGNISPEMKRCAVDRFGDRFEKMLFSGELNPEDLKRVMEGCVSTETQGHIPQFEPDAVGSRTVTHDDTVGTICTTEYAPACGLKEVHCITTPCNSVKRTYPNVCNLKADRAAFVHMGECDSASTGATGTYKEGYNDDYREGSVDDFNQYPNPTYEKPIEPRFDSFKEEPPEYRSFGGTRTSDDTHEVNSYEEKQFEEFKHEIEREFEEFKVEEHLQEDYPQEPTAPPPPPATDGTTSNF